MLTNTIFCFCSVHTDKEVFIRKIRYVPSSQSKLSAQVGRYSHRLSLSKLLLPSFLKKHSISSEGLLLITERFSLSQIKRQ